MYVAYDVLTRGYFSAGAPRGKDVAHYEDISALGTDMVAPSNAYSDQSQYDNETFTTNFFLMMNIMSLYSGSFACHYNAPKFYRELKDRNPGKFLMITAISFAIVAGVNILFALTGYFRFGGMVPGNILEAYNDVPMWEKDDIVVRIAWVGMAFSVTTSYPLISNSARSALFEVLNMVSNGRIPTLDKVEHIPYMIATLVIVLITGMVGVWGVDISLLGKIKGATTTIGLCGILPAIMLLVKVKSDAKLSLETRDEVSSEERDALLAGEPAPEPAPAAVDEEHNMAATSQKAMMFRY